MSTVPYIFAIDTGNIPLSQLDANFANVKASVDSAVTVSGNAQPNITSVGTLTSVSSTGTVTAASVIANVANISGLEITSVNFANITANAQSTSLSPTRSTTILIANNTGYTHTVNMPVSPTDGQIARFTISGNTVTLLVGTGTVTPTFAGNATAGTGYKYVYRSSNTTWYKTV